MSDGKVDSAKGAKIAALTPDICVIGAGSGGIGVATAAAAFGVPVVLVERRETGGRDAGLVIKALVEAGSQAQNFRDATRFGFGAQEPTLNPVELYNHIQRTLAVPAAHHRAERLQALGITLLRGEAHFVSRSAISVGSQLVKARRFVVATGSRPQRPALVDGLDPALVLTEDDLATVKRLPESLVVLGAGGRATALAQALKRLGSHVTLVAPGGLLPDYDAEAVMLLRRKLLREGVQLHEDGEALRVEASKTGVRVIIRNAGGELVLEAARILVCDADQADIDGLDLDLAGVRRDPKGIVVDAGLRTANRRVYAIGSCAGGGAAGVGDPAADEHVGIVLRDALFRRSSRVDASLNPHIVWSRPEIATVGQPDRGVAKPGTLRFLRAPFAETPGALASGDTEGFVKIVSDSKGRVLGVTIVGLGAAEMIAPWCVAMKASLNVSDIAAMPFATLSGSEASRRAALSFHGPATGSPSVRRLIGFLRRFG